MCLNANRNRLPIIVKSNENFSYFFFEKKKYSSIGPKAVEAEENGRRMWSSLIIITCRCHAPAMASSPAASLSVAHSAFQINKYINIDVCTFWGRPFSKSCSKCLTERFVFHFLFKIIIFSYGIKVNFEKNALKVGNE